VTRYSELKREHHAGYVKEHFYVLRPSPPQFCAFLHAGQLNGTFTYGSLQNLVLKGENLRRNAVPFEAAALEQLG
jgi:hypothetical protein